LTGFGKVAKGLANLADQRIQIRFLPRTHPLQQESGRQLGALRQGGKTDKPNPYKKARVLFPRLRHRIWIDHIIPEAIDLADHVLHALDAQGTSLTARLRFNKAEGDTPDVRDEVINSSISGFVCGSSGNAIRSGEPAA
jgi:hypothetical protein